jgi:hypothetical protein
MDSITFEGKRYDLRPFHSPLRKSTLTQTCKEGTLINFYLSIIVKIRFSYFTNSMKDLWDMVVDTENIKSLTPLHFLCLVKPSAVIDYLKHSLDVNHLFNVCFMRLERDSEYTPLMFLNDKSTLLSVEFQRGIIERGLSDSLISRTRVSFKYLMANLLPVDDYVKIYPSYTLSRSPLSDTIPVDALFLSCHGSLRQEYFKIPEGVRIFFLTKNLSYSPKPFDSEYFSDFKNPVRDTLKMIEYSECMSYYEAGDMIENLDLVFRDRDPEVNLGLYSIKDCDLPNHTREESSITDPFNVIVGERDTLHSIIKRVTNSIGSKSRVTIVNRSCRNDSRSVSIHKHLCSLVSQMSIDTKWGRSCDTVETDIPFEEDILKGGKYFKDMYDSYMGGDIIQGWEVVQLYETLKLKYATNK